MKFSSIPFFERIGATFNVGALKATKVTTMHDLENRKVEKFKFSNVLALIISSVFNFGPKIFGQNIYSARLQECHA